MGATRVNIIKPYLPSANRCCIAKKSVTYDDVKPKMVVIEPRLVHANGSQASFDDQEGFAMYLMGLT